MLHGHLTCLRSRVEYLRTRSRVGACRAICVGVRGLTVFRLLAIGTRTLTVGSIPLAATAVVEHAAFIRFASDRSVGGSPFASPYATERAAR